MENKFVKKFWDESNIIFYLHFQNGIAIRQIEVSRDGIKYLSVSNSVNGDSFLYDQSLDELELEDTDFITEEEFQSKWKPAIND